MLCKLPYFDKVLGIYMVKTFSTMIHIISVHWQSDQWIDIQLKYLNKYMNAPFRMYVSLNDIPKGHEDKFFYSCSIPEKSHAFKLNILAKKIMEASDTDPNDYIIFLDGDAFPVGDVMGYVEENINKYPLIAVQRRENFDTQPHPCFCITTVDFWNRINGDWEIGYKWKNLVGEEVSDVGGNLLKILEDHQVEWLPMLRSNKKDLHPLFFGIYEDVIYHHGAGFRIGLSRVSWHNKRKEVKRTFDYRLNESVRKFLNVFNKGDNDRQAERKLKIKVKQAIIKDSEKLDEFVHQLINDDFYFFIFLIKPDGRLNIHTAPCSFPELNSHRSCYGPIWK